MFVTAVKIATIEALVAGFNALNPTGNLPSNTSLDLTPNSVTIEYPLEEVAWPAIFVQFRPTSVRWQGLSPDTYITASGVTISGSPAMTASRIGYFEGNIDFQILAMHSEERDRLWDSVYNLVLMEGLSPASNAFYTSLNNNDLLGITLLPTTVQGLGDTVAPGTPFSPEELTYETSLRVQCVGDFYENKFSTNLPTLTAITVSGSLVFNPTL